MIQMYLHNYKYTLLGRSYVSVNQNAKNIFGQVRTALSRI